MRMSGYDITSIIIAIISSAGSSGVFTYYWNKKLQRSNARLGYEYEARKRLYMECEPILFQLNQLSEVARRRISHMPERVKQGRLFTEEEYLRAKEKLGQDKQQSEEQRKNLLGWLSFPNYYMLSTIYHLLSPMAAFKILQSRLTTVDLELDPMIKTTYLLAKHLYLTFSADTDLADSPKSGDIRYDQYDQGIFAGYLDNMTEALIEYYNEPSKTPRIRSFGEFTEQYVKECPVTGTSEKKVVPPFDRAYKILLFFHPDFKQVLWRILVEQLYLYNAMHNIYDERRSKNFQNTTEILKNRPLKLLPHDQPKDFETKDKNLFLAVESHLCRYLELEDLIDKELKQRCDVKKFC